MLIFNIKDIRKDKGFSISRLAKLTNLSRTYIRELENNKRSNVSISVLYKIANILEVNIKDLFYTECDIIQFKKELYSRIDKFGLDSKEVLEISQILDLLINIDLKEQSQNGDTN